MTLNRTILELKFPFEGHNEQFWRALNRTILELKLKEKRTKAEALNDS